MDNFHDLYETFKTNKAAYDIERNAYNGALRLNNQLLND